jgi:uncharacterized protein (TIGR01655 family)
MSTFWRIFLATMAALALLWMSAPFISSKYHRIDKDQFYVKVNQEGNITKDIPSDPEFLIYNYSLPAYDRDGKTANLTFTHVKPIRQQAYLRVYAKKQGDGKYTVSAWEEVQKIDIPEVALKYLQ